MITFSKMQCVGIQNLHVCFHVFLLLFFSEVVFMSMFLSLVIMTIRTINAWHCAMTEYLIYFLAHIKGQSCFLRLITQIKNNADLL